MVENKKQLVDTLIAQHRKLQKDLSEVLAIAQSSELHQGAQVLARIAIFNTDLTEHLTLENGTFYPEYLTILSNAGQDSTSTKKFIAEMVKIGETVANFFKSYSTPESINNATTSFVIELTTIIRVLNMRIETEEEGVYGMFLTLK
jgi:regulator of sigma D